MTENRVFLLLSVSCVLLLCIFVRESATQPNPIALSFVTHYDTFTDFFNFTNRCIFSADGANYGTDFESETVVLATTTFRLRTRRDLLINLDVIIPSVAYASDAPPRTSAPLLPKKAVRGEDYSDNSGVVTVNAWLCNARVNQSDPENCLPFQPAPRENEIPRICLRGRPEPVEQDVNCWIGPAQYQPLEVTVLGFGIYAEYYIDSFTVAPSELTLFARNVPRGDWTLRIEADVSSMVVVGYDFALQGICLSQAVLTVQPATFTDVL